MVAILPLFFLGAPVRARRQLADPAQGSNLPSLGTMKVAKVTTLTHPGVATLPQPAEPPNNVRFGDVTVS